MNAARSAGSNLSLEPSRIDLLVGAQFSYSLQFRIENGISGITSWATRFSTTATLWSQQPPGFQMITVSPVPLFPHPGMHLPLWD
jgi:hypothetical protein